MSTTLTRRLTKAARPAILGAFAVAFAVIPGGNTIAIAAGTETAVQVAKPTVARLQLDCTHLSPRVRRYAINHRYCPADPLTVGRATLNPNNTMPGTCGTSFIELTNLGHGNAGVRYGFNSSLGIVVSRFLAVNWINTTFDRGNSIPDNGLMFSSSYSPPQRTISTGSGNVSVDLTGGVQLIWGATCQLLIPSDDKKIS